MTANRATTVAILLFSTAFFGCSKGLPTIITAEELCRDWQHKTVSKQDKLTEPTASQIEADNKSRPNWGCAYGENKAKS